MNVMTWNVLHRVHAENYREPVVTRWPEESARVKAVTALVLKAVTADRCELVLLQEVSGDVLNELHHRLPHSVKICSHQVPRVPKLKVPATLSLYDASEHVVIIGPAQLEVLHAQTAADDAGKGLIAARVAEGLVAISTHVSWGSKGTAQLKVLQELMASLPGTVVVGGDFNAERGQVTHGLGDGYVVTELGAGSRRTRQSPDGEGSDIDHLLCRGGAWVDAHVTDAHELSDHSPLVATLAALAR